MEKLPTAQPVRPAVAAASPTIPGPAASPRHRDWAPHMWVGMDFFAWLRLLARHRFAVHWRYIYVAIIVMFLSFFHTVLRVLQDAIYGRRIRRTVIRQPPIFILGHWRTGTTLLHEFLVQDERFGSPTTYECFSPNDFLVTEPVVTRMWFLLPSRRPMDNMKMAWDRPQEDEFALCLLGARSPYRTIAFPNHAPDDENYLDFQGVSPRGVRRWQRHLERFLRTITFRKPKRLVLKSPPHTGRIPVLQQMFPGAVFIHIVRDPYVVFPSTVHLWKALYRQHGLQPPDFRNLEEHVYFTFLRIYQALDRGRKLVDPKFFYELKYEHLVRDPVGEMRKLYDHLGLGGFNKCRPRLEAYLASIKGYETNKYALTPEQRAQISRRWAPVIERYGYVAVATPS
jgi:omega-hydroxy-beta-dihydromenaquinone-9 sulfotransferase